MKTIVSKAGKEAEYKAGQVLKEGGIVAFPTDTVYGLGAVFSDEAAVKKIFEAKGRDEGKPLSILVGDADQVRMLSDDIPESAWKLMDAFWPGALTVIIKKNSRVPLCVSAGGETVGVRMPDNETARNIIREAGAPLAAPSANTSGKRSSVSAHDVLEDLDGKIDMLIDGGECLLKVSSTVLNLTGDRPEILRQGLVTREMIDAVLEK